MEKIDLNKHIKYYSTINNTEDKEKLNNIKVNVIYSSRNYRRDYKNRYNHAISNYQNLSENRNINSERENNKYIYTKYKKDDTMLKTYSSLYEMKTFVSPIVKYTSGLYKKEPKLKIKIEGINYKRIMKY